MAPRTAGTVNQSTDHRRVKEHFVFSYIVVVVLIFVPSEKLLVEEQRETRRQFEAKLYFVRNCFDGWWWEEEGGRGETAVEADSTPQSRAEQLQSVQASTGVH